MKKTDNDADVAFVQALAAVLRDNDLAELEVERGSKSEGRLTVRLSRVAAGPPPAPAVQHAAPVATAPAPAATDAAAPAETSDPASLPGAITSPMVGTVYLKPEPEAAPFVKVGDTVEEGATLLIVEAMKTMNHIHAPATGTVKRILVEDGAPVEYGAPLMVVE